MRQRIYPLVLLGLAIVLPATAQREKAPVKPETARFGDPSTIASTYQDYLYGVIKTIDPGEMVLEKTKFGIDQTFKFNAKTKYLHDGKPSTHDRLKVGDQVWAQVKTEKKTGDMIVKKVLTGVAFAPGSQ